jgi:hypothetical protein
VVPGDQRAGDGQVEISWVVFQDLADARQQPVHPLPDLVHLARGTRIPPEGTIG